MTTLILKGYGLLDLVIQSPCGCNRLKTSPLPLKKGMKSGTGENCPYIMYTLKDLTPTPSVRAFVICV